MNFNEAIFLIEKRMNNLLEQEGMKDICPYEISRGKDFYTNGFYSSREQKIFINVDKLYYNLPNPASKIKGSEKTHFYTPFKKMEISQEQLDSVLITQCHELVHAKDFLFTSREITSKEDLERFILENAASYNPSFYTIHYKNLSVESRAIANSVNMARDYLINYEGLSKGEANLRIINALNVGISRESNLCVLRENPEYNRFAIYDSALNNDQVNTNKCKQFLDDVSFHSYEEVETAVKNLIESSRYHDFTDRNNFHTGIAAFSTINVKKEDYPKLRELNERLFDLGFSRGFYNSLSQKERICLNISVVLNFFPEYSKLNEKVRGLPSFLNYHVERGSINPEDLRLNYFEEKLREYNSRDKREEAILHYGHVSNRDNTTSFDSSGQIINKNSSDHEKANPVHTSSIENDISKDRNGPSEPNRGGRF